MPLPPYALTGWGNTIYGGDSTAVASALNGSNDALDVKQIYSTGGAFAALRADGSVVTWGEAYRGGNSTAVATALNGSNDALDVKQIYSTGGAFAALRADGSVVTWGDGGAGGYSVGVANQLNGAIDVVNIFSTERAFAALRADGSVVTWGNGGYGGDSSSVASQLNGTVDVIQIFSTNDAFAALRADGSLVTWGDGNYGGDSSAVTNQISSGVVDVANIYTDTPSAGSATYINENIAANSVVGTLSSTDPDTGDTFTYNLAVGSADNAAFTISGNQLKIKASPDFETKSSYNIIVRTIDQGGLYFDKALTIGINNVNETPSGLTLSATSINEIVAANIIVGTFSSTDPDTSDTFTYSLIAGGADNAAFTINGNQLQINNSPDFETKASYSILVRSTDQGGLFVDKAVTIAVNDLNESPTGLTLSATSSNENIAANSVISTLSSTDPRHRQHVHLQPRNRRRG
jgi:hypothetical protein